MSKIQKILVCLCADTEDNHPNYLPGWKDYGSNYNIKKVKPKFDWVNYWDELIFLFNKYNFKVTWFLRVDTCIKDAALKKFKPYLKKLKKHEFGIHIHTLDWDNNLWRQTLNPVKEQNIVNKSIQIFKNTLGFTPRVSRIGWNAMSNSIMTALQKNNIKYDCSAVPGYYSEGFFNGRDNIIDWRDCPRTLYNPSAEDYKNPGNMKIIEAPISSMDSKNIVYNNSYVKFLNLFPAFLSNFVINLGTSIIKKLNLNPHSNFIISPNWNLDGIKKLINQYVNNDEKLLIGYFHPSDILDPKGGLNKDYLKKMDSLLSYLSQFHVESVTISEAIKKIEK